MGYRLEGPCIQHKEKADIISDGIPFGAVQVPGDVLTIISPRLPRQSLAIKLGSSKSLRTKPVSRSKNTSRGFKLLAIYCEVLIPKDMLAYRFRKYQHIKIA